MMNLVKVLAGIVLVLAVLFITIAVFGGASLLLYLDLPSLVLVTVIPAILLFLHCGPKGIGTAFTAAFGSGEKSSADKRTALSVFRFTGHSLLLTGGVGFIVGMIAVLAHIEDRASVGPNLAVAIITFFYALLLDLIIVQPLVFILRKELAEESCH